MNIILIALVAAAMGALTEFLPRPVRMALFTVAAFLGACTGTASDDIREEMQ